MTLLFLGFPGDFVFKMRFWPTLNPWRVSGQNPKPLGFIGLFHGFLCFLFGIFFKGFLVGFLMGDFLFGIRRFFWGCFKPLTLFGEVFWESVFFGRQIPGLGVPAVEGLGVCGEAFGFGCLQRKKHPNGRCLVGFFSNLTTLMFFFLWFVVFLSFFFFKDDCKSGVWVLLSKICLFPTCFGMTIIPIEKFLKGCLEHCCVLCVCVFVF